MATTPQFAATPRVSYVTISIADSGRAGTGVMGALFLAGNQGSRVDWIHYHAVTPVTPGVVRTYISGAAGVTLFNEIAVPALTPTTSGANWSFDYYPAAALLLQSGNSLRVATELANEFDVTAFGGDF